MDASCEMGSPGGLRAAVVHAREYHALLLRGPTGGLMQVAHSLSCLIKINSRHRLDISSKLNIPPPNQKFTHHYRKSQVTGIDSFNYHILQIFNLTTGSDSPRNLEAEFRNPPFDHFVAVRMFLNHVRKYAAFRSGTLES